MGQDARRLGRGQSINLSRWRPHTYTLDKVKGDGMSRMSSGRHDVARDDNSSVQIQ